MTTGEEKAVSWADRLSGWMEAMAPLFDQPHLASVRDGLIALMPLLITGAFSLLILQFPVQGWLDYLDTNTELAAKLWVPFNITYGLLSPFATISIAYSLARRRGLDPLMPSALALLAFITLVSPITGAWGEGGLPGTYFDNSGLFSAILVGLLSVEIYRFFVERNIVIRMPPQVPPAIASAFVALVPGIVILLIAWVIRVLLDIDVAGGIVQILSYIVPAASSYPAAAAAETFHAFLWTLGIHGDLTIGIVLQPIWTNNLVANAQAAAAGEPLPYIYTDLFRSYVVPGGSGATLPLAIYLIRSKSARLRRVGWLGIWPGIFNINEPITFGTPVIFNPVLAIPFIIITFLNTSFAWLMHVIGFVTPTYVAAPWTLPTPILMYLATGYDWRAIIVGLMTEFVIPGIIWYPAFKAWERQVLEKEGGEEAVAPTGAPAPAR
ncbi:MAG TPA: PTS sugar transporter subunit IIC [Chloroflexi bacterium]|nr:PTS sugar transporter subunit IIC [Chloroflexota bacterium]